MPGTRKHVSVLLLQAAVLFALPAMLATLPSDTSAAQQQPPRSLTQQNLKADLSRTGISFSLDATAHAVHGEFSVTRVDLQVADVTEGKLSGEIVVDARSGRTGNDSRDRRMHDEVLESERYPEIVFRPNRLLHGQVGPEAHFQAEVQGTLTIHGADHAITMPVQLNCTNSRCTAEGEFTVPYVEWGMKNPSNFLLRVGKTVAVRFHTAIELGPLLAR